MKLFVHKILHFEYWPWKWFYAPLYPYYAYLALRNRDIFFPAAVNMSLPLGGFFNEDKELMLARLNPHFLPKAQIITSTSTLELNFPFVAKPLHAQRGTNVSIIKNGREFEQYKKLNLDHFIIQEYITFDIELAVLYSRLPGEAAGIVSSVTQKEFLTVTGDGTSTVKELLQKNVRALMVGEDLYKNTKVDVSCVLAKGEHLVVEPVGNHCRGTLFRNASKLDFQKIARVCDKIVKDFDGFHFGRFDLKVGSIADLYEGKNVRVLELNGVNSDAAHVFDPDMSLVRAYKDIAWHWNRLADIARLNNLNGFKANYNALFRSFMGKSN